MNVKQKWKNVQEKIQVAALKSHRNLADIHVLAVTKYVSVSRMEEAYQAGLTQVAESKVQDALKKWNSIDEHIRQSLEWHFIGHLQSNKVKDMIDKFSFIHSLDRLSLAKEINKRVQMRRKIAAPSIQDKVACFVQLNISGEVSKQGIDKGQAEQFIGELQAYSHLEIVGLMTMAPFEENPEKARPIFQELYSIQQELQQKKWQHAPLKYLSMGMSNDYQVAIEEGATHIRLGTSLVGE